MPWTEKKEDFYCLKTLAGVFDEDLIAETKTLCSIFEFLSLEKI